jgi:hypothetical protein
MAVTKGRSIQGIGTAAAEAASALCARIMGDERR